MESVLDHHQPDLLQQAFEDLHFANRGLNLPGNIYHVYCTPTEFVPVEADSAYQAMRLSGIDNPLKIRRYSVHRMPYLTGDMLVELTAPEALSSHAQAQPAPVPQAVAEVEALAEPVAESVEDAVMEGEAIADDVVDVTAAAVEDDPAAIDE